MSKCSECYGHGVKNSGIPDYEEFTCPNCHGTGIEPEVELISVKKRWTKSFHVELDKGTHSENFVKKIQADARAVGAQEQKKVDAGICRKYGTIQNLEKTYSDDITSGDNLIMVWAKKEFEKAANAIQNNKPEGEEDETTNIIPTTDKSDSV